MENQKRCHEIDVLKAVSITAVVAIHAIGTGFAPDTGMGKMIGDITRFAVPGLLFASGFLFDKKRLPALPLTRKLLLRIIPPYLFCSVLIMLLNLPGSSWAPGHGSVKEFGYHLLWGSSVGIYYFVFVITYLYGMALVLRRLPEKGMVALWGVCIVLTWVFWNRVFWFVAVPPDRFLFVFLRYPLVHLLPFISGWVWSVYRQPICKWMASRSKILFGAAVVADLIALQLAQSDMSPVSVQLILQLHIYLAIFMMMWLGMRYIKGSRVVLFLSNGTYTIFLLHFPLVRWFQSLFPVETAGFSFLFFLGALTWGLVGSIMIIASFRRVLGPYSKYVIGT